MEMLTDVNIFKSSLIVPPVPFNACIDVSTQTLFLLFDISLKFTLTCCEVVQHISLASLKCSYLK